MFEEALNLIYIFASANCKFPFYHRWPYGAINVSHLLLQMSTLEKKYWGNKCETLILIMALWKISDSAKDPLSLVSVHLILFFFNSALFFFFSRRVFLAICNWGERCEILFLTLHTLQRQTICYLFSYGFCIASTICFLPLTDLTPRSALRMHIF